MHTPPADSSLRRRAEFALLATAVFWGFSFPLAKAVAHVHERLAPGESGWFITTSTIWPRFVVAAVLLLPLTARALMSLTRLEILQGAGLAVFVSAGLILQVDGLKYTEASTSAFLSQCYVVLVPVAVFGRERRWPPWRYLGSIGLVVGGVAVLADLDWHRLHIGRGELETIIATVFFAAQILWLERGAFRRNRAVPVTLVMFVVTGALFLGGSWLLASEPAALMAPLESASWLAFTAGLAVICTVGAFTLMNIFQPCLSAAEAGIIYASEPVWASLLALFLPGWMSAWGGLDYANESLTWRLVIGGCLILAANWIIQTKPPVAVATKEKPRLQ
jgi:drug/metabolite transporter (DMT)-like permease